MEKNLAILMHTEYDSNGRPWYRLYEHDKPVTYLHDFLGKLCNTVDFFTDVATYESILPEEETAFMTGNAKQSITVAMWDDNKLFVNRPSESIKFSVESAREINKNFNKRLNPVRKKIRELVKNKIFEKITGGKELIQFKCLFGRARLKKSSVKEFFKNSRYVEIVFLYDSVNYKDNYKFRLVHSKNRTVIYDSKSTLVYDSEK